LLRQKDVEERAENGAKKLSVREGGRIINPEIDSCGNGTCTGVPDLSIVLPSSSSFR